MILPTQTAIRTAQSCSRAAKGPVQIIGPTAIPVRGGYAAVWIKANPQDLSGDTETAEIHIRLADTPVERKCVKIDVVKSDIVMG